MRRDGYIAVVSVPVLNVGTSAEVCVELIVQAVVAARRRGRHVAVALTRARLRLRRLVDVAAVHAQRQVCGTGSVQKS